MFIISARVVFGSPIVSITVYERTGFVLPFAFIIDDSRLGKNPSFGSGSYDFVFPPYGTEIYDVYLSNFDGTANPEGMYLTIDCIRPEHDTGFGAGHNIDAVSLDFADGTHLWATIVTTYLLGYNQTITYAQPTNALGELDDQPTYMGDQFSSLTLGFGLDQPIRAASVPEPSTLILLAFGLVGAVGFRKKIKR
jgi:hypothetical protein